MHPRHDRVVLQIPELPQALEQTLLLLHEQGRSRFSTLDEVVRHLASSPIRRRAVDQMDVMKVARELGVDSDFAKALVRDRRFRAAILQEVLDTVFTIEAKAEIWNTVLLQLVDENVPLGQKKGMMELIEQQQGLLKPKKIQAEIREKREIVISLDAKQNKLAAAITGGDETPVDRVPGNVPGIQEDVIDATYNEDDAGQDGDRGDTIWEQGGEGLAAAQHTGQPGDDQAPSGSPDTELDNRG